MISIVYSRLQGDKSIDYYSQLSSQVRAYSRCKRILLSVIIVPLLFRRNHHRPPSFFYVNCWIFGSSSFKSESRHKSLHYLTQSSKNCKYNNHQLSRLKECSGGKSYTVLDQNHLFNRRKTLLNCFSSRSSSSTGISKGGETHNSSNTTRTTRTTANWDKYTVVQLKELLREKGLKVSGRKADLIERLAEYNNTINFYGKDTTTIMAPRRSTRKRNSNSVRTEEEVDKSSNSDSNDQKTSASEGEVAKSKKVKVDSETDDVLKTGDETSTKMKVVKATSASAKKTAKVTSKGKKAKVEPQRITEIDQLPKLWDAEEALSTKGSYTFKIMSWNVAGLRALVRKEPEALSKLANDHDLDVICLQETKLQKIHLDDTKLKLKEILVTDGFDSHWSCSTAKKGYAGTVVFVKRRKADDENDTKKQAKLDSFFKKKDESKKNAGVTKQSSIGDIEIEDLIPSNVSLEIGVKEHDQEGRIITVEYPHFTLIGTYVPNSGQKLERLSYRTEKWDKHLLAYMKQKEKTRKKPIVWLGDLNVAHKALDVWNDGAKHLAKQAGTTAEERESFQQMLDSDDGSFVDAFRYLYPDAKGHYSYWSQRAGNRAPNKGLRLDYFICSASIMTDEPDQKVVVRDSYMIKSQLGSDHCPVVLAIEIKK